MILYRYQHDMDPYACCYCGVTKQTQKQIVECTIQEHPTNDTSIPFNNYVWLPYQSSKMVAIITKTRKFGPRNKIKSCNAELSKSLSCLSDNRSGRCGQCVGPIKHLPDLHINWITHILAKSIKWFVYSFKWYLGILKVSTTHFCVTCGNIHTCTIQ